MSKGNEQAFPAAYPEGVECGLTKRELFAAFAMAGFAVYPGANDYCASIQALADNAVRYADALLAALEVPRGD